MSYSKIKWLVVLTLYAGMSDADQIIQDDLSVKGSACVGIDCTNNESFGFDTLRLKENNLRIRFDDTSSSSSFPATDWELTANDSNNGGQNRFSIAEITSGTVPFTILGSAPNHSLYIRNNGNVGFGTAAPLVDLHVQSGNSPTLRLDQDGSSGFSSQAWDIGGNETNFFIRDFTNSSKLPFRIVSGATNNSLYIAADGDVGFETSTPDGQFDVAHFSNANNHAFLIDPTSNVGVNIDNGQTPLGLFDVQTTGGVTRFNVGTDGKVNFGTDWAVEASSGTGHFTIYDSGVERFKIDGSTGVITGAFDLGTPTFTNLSLPGFLSVTGTTNLQSTLDVSGLSSLKGGAKVTGGTFEVTGNSTLTGQLTVTDAASLQGTLTVTGVSTHNGGLSVSGGSGLSVTGLSDLNGNLEVLGTSTLSNDLSVTGNSTLTGDFKVTGNSIFDGNVGIGALTTATTLSKLHIQDTLAGRGASLIVENVAATNKNRKTLQVKNFGRVAITLDDTDTATGDADSWQLWNETGLFRIKRDASTFLEISNTGDTSLMQNLVVAGNINSSGDICTNNGCLNAVVSSKALKNVVKKVDAEDILNKLNTLDISLWSYKKEDASILHIGPMAEDFEAAFGLNGGVTDKISIVDLTGVAFASIQALNSKVKQQEEQINQLKQEIELIKKMLQKH